MSDELTFKEKAVLLILMAEAREIPNALLNRRYHTKLEKPGRERLQRRGLINVRPAGPHYFIELSDLGWKQCAAEFGGDIPAGGGAPGGALYAILGAVKRHVERTNLTYADFFAPAEDTPAASTADIQARIRSAYAALAREPGGWVALADLRDRLGGLDRAGVDDVLVDMNRTKDVRIVPESNQKVLTQRDWDAAVIIGNQHKHVISIGS